MKKLLVAAMTLSVVGVASQALADPYSFDNHNLAGYIDQFIADSRSGGSQYDMTFLNSWLSWSSGSTNVGRYPSTNWTTNGYADSWSTISGMISSGYNWLGNRSIGYFTPTGQGGSGAPVPEPATLLLMGAGMAGLVAARRKK